MFLVRHWLVLAGLICARCARLLIGISARATLELNGPTTPRTFESLTNCWRFWAPFCGSWTPLTASSRLETSIVKPSTVPAVWTAYLTPFRVGIRSELLEVLGSLLRVMDAADGVVEVGNLDREAFNGTRGLDGVLDAVQGRDQIGTAGGSGLPSAGHGRR